MYIGNFNKEKVLELEGNNFKDIIVISPDYSNINNYENIDFKEIIMYRTFYKLIQKVDKNTLIVLNECLQNKNLNDLYYNCINNITKLAGKVIIFQLFPFIESLKDFEILKKLNINNEKVKNKKYLVDINFIDCKIDSKEIKDYENIRNKLFAEIGNRNPDTIPNNLQLFSGKIKQKYVNNRNMYIGRNNKNISLRKYFTEFNKIENEIFVDLPLNFKDFIKYLVLSKKQEINVLTTKLKIDIWYKEKYTKWKEELYNYYAEI